MKPFGTWSAASSFSLGGIIGCGGGIITLVVLASATFYIAPIVLGVAILVGIGAGILIHVANYFKGATDKATKPNVQTRTVTEKVLTVVAVTGYVALAAVTVINVAKPTIETNPTAIVQETPIEVTQSQPALEPKYEGAASYINSTSICSCDSCDGTIFVAEMVNEGNSDIAGEFYFKENPELSIPFSGNATSISGHYEKNTSCDAIMTDTLKAKIIEGNLFVGTLTTTYTPGDCGMDKCGGTFTFSLPKK